MCSSMDGCSVVSNSSYSAPISMTTSESMSERNGPVRKITVSPRSMVRVDNAMIAASFT